MLDRSRLKNQFASLVLLIIFYGSAIAQAAIPVTYETARSLGMGGTSVAIADDHQALFSNPAGLGLRTESAYSLVNGFFARSEDFDKVDSHISALNNQDSAGSRNSNYNNLIEIMGQSGWQSYSNMAYYLGSTGFGMAAYYREVESFAVNNPVNPSITSQVNKDSLISGSVSRSFNERQNLFKDRAIGWWGATMKFVSRQASQNTYYARDFSALSSSILRDTDRSGATMDFDFGALWQISNPWKPTFGVFIGNILNSEFSSDVGALPREFAVGASFRPLTGPPERNDKLLLAIDYRDDGDERTTLTKLRLGAELKLSRHFMVQTGIRSGYLTAGAGIVWNDWHFQASTYAEELGQNPGNNEDRRWALSTTWEF
jgi:hypothetical protein